MQQNVRAENSVANNFRTWNEYGWPLDGDEWDGQARRCGQPYAAWQQSLVETFIGPFVGSSARVLEIGAGHGRWSRHLVGRSAHLTLLDLSPRCIEHCRRLLAGEPNVTFLVGDGTSLAGVADQSIDFVWSYDVFVHLDVPTIDAYLGEIRRVLRPDGRAVLHHAGRRHLVLPLRALRRAGPAAARLYCRLSTGERGGDDGWRSDVSPRVFRRLATGRGLRVVDQLRRWGAHGEFGVPRFRDRITVLSLPGGEVS